MDVMSMMGFRDLKQKSAIRNHCDRLATICEISQRKARYYYGAQLQYFKFSISEGRRVFEIGCGLIDLWRRLTYWLVPFLSFRVHLVGYLSLGRAFN